MPFTVKTIANNENPDRVADVNRQHQRIAQALQQLDGQLAAEKITREAAALR